MKNISRTVWILSLVSLLTDTASEMLYPVMPIYLKSIGFSVVLIGVLEGFAEALAGLSKGYFGKWSDTTAKRVPFVQVGYALSAISKPLMAVYVFPVWVFMARTVDRLGKGIRTGARDAMLSGEATPQTKGAIFGFHRSMDTLGAVLGPVLALWYLHYHPENYKTLFYIAFVPGLLAILATRFLNDKPANKPVPAKRQPFFAFLHYWKESPVAYKKLAAGLLLFALFNSSDVFLLLKAKEAGLHDTTVIGIYIFYNLIYALFAFPAGLLADRIGLKSVFITGLVLFAFVYAGMAVNSNVYVFAALFFVYGVYAAATEGISKAWISTLVEPKDTATAIGNYAGLQSICAMLASSLTGLIWYTLGSTAAFALTAGVTVLVVVYVVVAVPATLAVKR